MKRESMARDISFYERTDVTLLPCLPLFGISREKGVGKAAPEPMGLDLDSSPAGDFRKQERSEFQNANATGKSL